MPGIVSAARRSSARSGGNAFAPSPAPGQAPILAVLCGPSHSGKTTFARGLGDGFQVVSSDAVRERLTGKTGPSDREDEVWEAFEAAKRKALDARRSVVLDACHMSEQARWHSLQGADGHRKVCILFDLPLETVLARCRETGRLPPEEVERMWRDFQAVKPTLARLLREGYDEVQVVRE